MKDNPDIDETVILEEIKRCLNGLRSSLSGEKRSELMSRICSLKEQDSPAGEAPITAKSKHRRGYTDQVAATQDNASENRTRSNLDANDDVSSSESPAPQQTKKPKLSFSTQDRKGKSSISKVGDDQSKYGNPIPEMPDIHNPSKGHRNNLSPRGPQPPSRSQTPLWLGSGSKEPTQGIPQHPEAVHSKHLRDLKSPTTPHVPQQPHKLRTPSAIAYDQTMPTPTPTPTFPPPAGERYRSEAPAMPMYATAAYQPIPQPPFGQFPSHYDMGFHFHPQTPQQLPPQHHNRHHITGSEPYQRPPTAVGNFPYYSPGHPAAAFDAMQVDHTRGALQPPSLAHPQPQQQYPAFTYSHPPPPMLGALGETKQHSSYGQTFQGHMTAQQPWAGGSYHSNGAGYEQRGSTGAPGPSIKRPSWPDELMPDS